MNPFNLESWSERQQVIAIIAAAGLAIFLLWFFALYPQHKRRYALEAQIQDMRGQLERSNYLLGEAALQKRREAALQESAALKDEWKEVAATIASFSREGDALDPRVGKIDYKMALFEARQRLGRKAGDAGISLPPELGMLDAIESDEDARTLMMQLRSLERLVDLLLDIEISMLRNVEPLPPLAHAQAEGAESYLEEYPIHVEFYGDLKNLYDLFHAILEPEHVFALRRMRVRAASPNNDDLLKVDAVLSALVLTRDPGEMALAAVAPETATHSAPMGH